MIENKKNKIIKGYFDHKNINLSFEFLFPKFYMKNNTLIIL